jgi:glycosyltransferase involved in cell wall biosynthesis
MKLSATIITFNEENNISDCLASLDFVDEIIVVDSGSSDATESICRNYNKVRFIRNEWPGYGKQKNVAADLAMHDWILNVDADERVTAELCASIMSADISNHVAFRMARENYFGKRWIKRCGWYPDYNIRFYDRRVCCFRERSVHESLEYSGHIGILSGNLRHFSYADISDYLKRMDKYSTLAADELLKEGKVPTLMHIMVKPVATFVKMFFVRGGFFEGGVGYILSCLYAYYTMCKYAKAWERHRNEMKGGATW